MHARLAVPLANMQSPRALLPSRSQGSRSSGVSDTHAQACGQQPWVGQCTSQQHGLGADHQMSYAYHSQRSNYQSPFMNQHMIAVSSALHANADDAFQVERSSGGLNFDKQYSLIGLPGSPSDILLTELMPDRTSQDSACSDSAGSKHSSQISSSQLSMDAAPSSSVSCERVTGCSGGSCALEHTLSLASASSPASPSRSTHLLYDHSEHHTARQARGHSVNSNSEISLLQACAIAASNANASPRLQSVLARGLKYVTGSVSGSGGANHKPYINDGPRSPTSQLARSQSVCITDTPPVRARMLSRCITEGAGKMNARSIGDVSSPSASCHVPSSYSSGSTRFRPLLPPQSLQRLASSEAYSSSFPGEGIISKASKQSAFLPPVTC